MNYIVPLIGMFNVIDVTVAPKCIRSKPFGLVHKFIEGESFEVLHTTTMRDISSLFDADDRLVYAKNPFANRSNDHICYDAVLIFILVEFDFLKGEHIGAALLTCYDNEGNKLQDIGYVIGYDGKQPNRLLVSKIIDVRGAIHGDCQEDPRLSSLMLISSGTHMLHFTHIYVLIITLIAVFHYLH
ncbi:unnamed protein product [Angiostrongylus costaricensis]|uniref:Histone acetyltransferase n=1 Tax=Angiostrongylus costaricensis TaxID=334426 RepID=A0A0R3Q246_ANGCS|nr:unnamed protein product [Angiostrongylus costaricensis]